jgi:hypothetical protein
MECCINIGLAINPIFYMTTITKVTRVANTPNTIIELSTPDEVLEYCFIRELLYRHEWRGWFPETLHNVQVFLDTTPTISQTKGDLALRFGVINPNKTAKPNNVEHWIRRGWSEDDAKHYISEQQKSRNAIKQLELNLDHWIGLGHSIEEARVLVDDKRYGFTARRPEYWVKRGYSYEEAVEQVTAHQGAHSPKTIGYWEQQGCSREQATKEVQKVQQHAADGAKAAWKAGLIDKSTRNTNLQYWVNKCNGNVEQAEVLLSNRQRTFSLDICIEKYGEVDGLIRFKERQALWHKNFKKQNYSKISQVLFDGVCQMLPDTIKELPIYYATRVIGNDTDIKNNEFTLELQETFCKPDFYIPDLELIIEFDGQYYHRTDDYTYYTADKKRRDDKILEMYPNMLISHITETEFNADAMAVIKRVVDTIQTRHKAFSTQFQ